jgi:hypothetical protein
MKRVLCITASLAVVTLSAFIGIYFGLVPNGPSRAFRLVEFEQFVATTDVFDDTGLVRYLFDFNTINVESTSGKLGPGSNCLFASFAAVPAETAHQVR